MAQTIGDLEPKALWRIFERLSRIPRGSGNEAAAADMVAEFGRGHGCEVLRDGGGNVLLRVKASPGRGGAATVVLQGHLDMVCEKDADVEFDFTKDALRLRIEEGFVTASGTTLGADNGIGLAAALALLDTPDAVHGPLEILCTVSEETGLTGAKNLEPGFVTGRTLLNLDTEEDGALYVGCAGGCVSQIRLPLRRAARPARARGAAVRVRGLIGGHSGSDIIENRANANRLLFRILSAARAARYKLVSVSGGRASNAIPREARAEIIIGPRGLGRLAAMARERLAEFKEEYGSVDPGIEVVVEQALVEGRPFRTVERDRVVDLVNALPDGVVAMSRDIPGLVETSNNVGVVGTNDDSFEVTCLARSSSTAGLDRMLLQIRSAAVLAGAEAAEVDRYPGWKPNMDSRVLAVARSVHKRRFGAEPRVTAIHAGLECGIIAERYPGMDTISLGPEIRGGHSPNERANIESVKRSFDLLKDLVDELSR